MSINRAQALVINKRDFRETSIIADFYTREFGKVSGLLKGVRSEPEKFASTLEPFSHNEIIFYKKTNSSLHLVSQCDLKNNFVNVRQNLAKIGVGSFMMDLLNAIMPLEDINEQVFDLTLDCLNELEVTNNPQKVMTIYKIRMLVLSGFKPHFDSCIVCQDKVLGQAKFSLNLGGLLCQGCLDRDLSSRAIFRGTVATILYIEKNDFKTSLNLGMNPQVKKELEVILNAFLNFHLERELKSQKVLNKMDVLMTNIK